MKTVSFLVLFSTAMLTWVGCDDDESSNHSSSTTSSSSSSGSTGGGGAGGSSTGGGGEGTGGHNEGGNESAHELIATTYSGVEKLEIDYPQVYWIDGASIFVSDVTPPATIGDMVVYSANAAPIDSFALDESHVYWSDESGVHRASRSGEDETNLVTGAAYGLTLIGETLYFHHAGSISSLSLQGAVLTVHADIKATISGVNPRIIVDDTYIYSSLIDGCSDLARIPIAGGDPECLPELDGLVLDFADDGTSLLSIGANKVWQIRKSDFVVTELIDAPDAERIEIHEATLFMATSTSFLRAQKLQGAQAQTLFTFDDEGNAPAYDLTFSPTRIYYGRSGMYDGGVYAVTIDD